MSIGYRPPSLEQTIKGPYGERRLKNREGVVIAAKDSQGESVWKAEGTIPDLHQRALEYTKTNPGYRVILIEFSCGGLVDGATLSSFETRSQA